LNVILWESGGEEFDDRAQDLNDGTLTALEQTDLTAARLRMFGGGPRTIGAGIVCLSMRLISPARP
jgi:hypothetical protein